MQWRDGDVIFIILLACVIAGTGLWFVIEAFHSLVVFFAYVVSMSGEL